MTATEEKIQKHRYDVEAFSRLDDDDDSVFYARDRFVSHLDSLALETVEQLIGSIVVEDEPRILDLTHVRLFQRFLPQPEDHERWNRGGHAVIESDPNRDDSRASGG